MTDDDQKGATKGHHAIHTTTVSWGDECPEVLTTSEDGLTKREYFAAMAMQGLLEQYDEPYTDREDVANCAVVLADALIKALNK